MSKFVIEEEIILKAMNGDEEAFSQIYNIYSNCVFFIAFQYHKNREIAEDIVQEVFIKIHSKIDTLKSPKAFGSWMYVITFRVCRNYDRSKIKFVGIHDDHRQIEDYPDTKREITSEIESERINTEVMGIMDGLSLPLRAVAILRFFGEYKVNEIADILDISSETVKSRLKKIRLVLKDELTKKGITKTYGVSIATPALLIEAYNSSYEQFITSNTLSDNVLQNIIGGGVVASSGTSAVTKLVIAGLTMSALIGGFFLWNQDTVQPVQVVSTARILDINYDTAWRNEEIYLEVETTNDNYDRITINDEETLKITYNGTYTVRLIKDDKVIDEKVIEISNIDYQSPTATYEKRGQYYYFFITEDLSGIDVSSIRFFVNGQLSNNFTFDESSGILIFKDDSKSAKKLYINDNAGNRLTITVK